MTEFASRLIEFAVSFAESAIKFYIPLFFTLRFLRDKDVEGQSRIIKYWCLYSIFYILDWVLEPIISKSIYPFFEIGLFVLLNYDKYSYTEKIYDSVISPLFESNKATIERFAGQVEQLFKQETRKLQKGVQQSFQAKAKRVAGSILVQVMNPNSGQDKQEKQQ